MSVATIQGTGIGMAQNMNSGRASAAIGRPMARAQITPAAPGVCRTLMPIVAPTRVLQARRTAQAAKRGRNAASTAPASESQTLRALAQISGALPSRRLMAAKALLVLPTAWGPRPRRRCTCSHVDIDMIERRCLNRATPASGAIGSYDNCCDDCSQSGDGCTCLCRGCVAHDYTTDPLSE